jgi:glycerate-2-kinase
MDHALQNFDQLATSDLRRDALAILEEGYAAIVTRDVINGQVFFRDNVLHIQEYEYDLSRYERIFLFCIGKCAADAGTVLEEILGNVITDGVVLDVRGVPLKRMQSEIGTHPFPTDQNITITDSIGKMLDDATEKDLILTVISGGGSSLLCLPNDMRCESLAQITESLMKSGASIRELNTVRKHMSQIQGGWFAERAFPAKVVSLIFSDVPGDDMSMIASGPTVMDTTTKEDAERILSTYNARSMCTLPYCDITETPKEEKYFQHVDNLLVLTNHTALDAMKKKAEELGYEAVIHTSVIEGEARSLYAKVLSHDIKKHSCSIYGGETTVYVKGKGKGGRNQEVALGALLSPQKDTVVIAAASDGWDNCDVAGAIVDDETLSKARLLGLDPQDFLDRNASYDFFELTKDAIKTGKTGSNVADFYITVTS